MKRKHAVIAERAITILNELDANIAVLNYAGLIIASNEAWQAFAANHCTVEGALPLTGQCKLL